MKKELSIYDSVKAIKRREQQELADALHKKFKYGIPLIVITQIAIAVYIFRENIQAYIYQ